MTRKQALAKAITIVEEANINEKEKQDIISSLHLCINELPFAKWTEAAIFDACDQFIIDHGRNIRHSDFDHADLPSHPTIKHRMGMTSKEFRDTYYPNGTNVTTRSCYCTKTPAEWKERFIAEYLLLSPKSAMDYNERRNKEHPSWYTLAKLLEIPPNWHTLLLTCNITPPARGGRRLEKKQTAISSSIKLSDINKTIEIKTRDYQNDEFPKLDTRDRYSQGIISGHSR